MKPRRPRSWDATGLVERAWKRLDPPTRDHLARRLGLKAATNLTKMNTGHLPMTIEYAERIVAAVPGLTVADLGAPTSAVAAADPTVLDRLEEAAAGVKALSLKLDLALDHVAERLAALEKQSARQDSRSQPTSRRRRKAG